MTDYEYQKLQAAYEETMSRTGEEEEFGQEEYVLYGSYEPLTVTITHILNNKSGIDFSSYAHTGLPVEVFAMGVGQEQFGGYYDTPISTTKWQQSQEYSKNNDGQTEKILCFHHRGITDRILIALPTGYEDAVIYQGTDKVKAKVLSTDESAVRSSGLIQSGEQYCEVELLEGKFKGDETRAVNMLSGSLESDKIFERATWPT